ncbi:unnamed protein product [Amoebophrya sp. A120]|nr:unnamed protein product [Amoebophrya sp. A120]|eukprot:GSA120T00011900001.1
MSAPGTGTISMGKASKATRQGAAVGAPLVTSGIDNKAFAPTGKGGSAASRERDYCAGEVAADCPPVFGPQGDVESGFLDNSDKDHDDEDDHVSAATGIKDHAAKLPGADAARSTFVSYETFPAKQMPDGKKLSQPALAKASSTAAGRAVVAGGLCSRAFLWTSCALMGLFLFLTIFGWDTAVDACFLLQATVLAGTSTTNVATLLLTPHDEGPPASGKNSSVQMEQWAATLRGKGGGATTSPEEAGAANATAVVSPSSSFIFAGEKQSASHSVAQSVVFGEELCKSRGRDAINQWRQETLSWMNQFRFPFMNRLARLNYDQHPMESKNLQDAKTACENDPLKVGDFEIGHCTFYQPYRELFEYDDPMCVMARDEFDDDGRYDGTNPDQGKQPTPAQCLAITFKGAVTTYGANVRCKMGDDLREDSDAWVPYNKIPETCEWQDVSVKVPGGGGDGEEETCVTEVTGTPGFLGGFVRPRGCCVPKGSKEKKIRWKLERMIRTSAQSSSMGPETGLHATIFHDED